MGACERQGGAEACGYRRGTLHRYWGLIRTPPPSLTNSLMDDAATGNDGSVNPTQAQPDRK